jgi:hypothetical protein
MKLEKSFFKVKMILNQDELEFAKDFPVFQKLLEGGKINKNGGMEFSVGCFNTEGMVLIRLLCQELFL